MALDLLPSPFAVCRLPAGSPAPEWAGGDGGLCSVTRTADEVSVVCPEGRVAPGVRRESGWRCMRVRGPLGFGEVGILASLASPLAAAGVPVFVVSTFDTDYLLVPGARLETAIDVLRTAGHRLHT